MQPSSFLRKIPHPGVDCGLPLLPDVPPVLLQQQPGPTRLTVSILPLRRRGAAASSTCSCSSSRCGRSRSRRRSPSSRAARSTSSSRRSTRTRPCCGRRSKPASGWTTRTGPTCSTTAGGRKSRPWRRELGIKYISRPDNRHFKAGNLNNAFERTDGEFVVVLDADHVPEPHFITRLIGYFRDERLGYVQTPHAFYNFDSFQARLDHKNRKYWEEGHLFYYVIQPGRNQWGCPIFAGSRRHVPPGGDPRRRPDGHRDHHRGHAHRHADERQGAGSRWPSASAWSPARRPRTSRPSTPSGCAGGPATCRS